MAGMIIICVALLSVLHCGFSVAEVENQNSGLRYSKIQDAIDSAESGDVLVVDEGEYAENLLVKYKSVVLKSINPDNAEIVKRTIIDAGLRSPVITLEGEATSGTYIYGLTLTRGKGERVELVYDPLVWPQKFVVEYWGSGINGDGYGVNIEKCIITGCEGHEALAIWNCADSKIYGNTIKDNVALPPSQIIRRGVHRAVYECNGILEGNTISGNPGEAISECSGQITKNVLSDNQAGVYGSSGLIANNHIYNNWRGIWNCDTGLIVGNICEYNSFGVSHSDATISNNIIRMNNSRTGGSTDGAGVSNCHGIIQFNLVYGNKTDDRGAGLYNCEGTIRNNIIWGNEAKRFVQVSSSTTPTFCIIQDWDRGGEGNITSTPLFVDAVNGDFRLLPGSPGIDMGMFVEEAGPDFLGNKRPQDGDGKGAGSTGDGSDFDIGPYEMTPETLEELRQMLLKGDIRRHILGPDSTSPDDAPSTPPLDRNGDEAIDIGDILHQESSIEGCELFAETV